MNNDSTNLTLITEAVRFKNYSFFEERNITIKEDGTNWLLHYSKFQDITGLTDLQMLCRGLIVCSVTGAIMARPFKRFRNYGENNHYPATNSIFHAFDKLDGSLVIVWFDGSNWRANTKGTFYGEEPRQRLIERHLAELNPNQTLQVGRTYLFELTGTMNQHVVHYNYASKLTHLCTIDNLTGKHTWSTKECLTAAPKDYSSCLLEELQSILSGASGSEKEGFVVVFADGTIFKMKGEDFVRLHRMSAGLTFASFVKGMADTNIQTPNDVAMALLRYIDANEEEAKDTILDWYHAVISATNPLLDKVTLLLNMGLDDKEAAMMISNHVVRNTYFGLKKHNRYNPFSLFKKYGAYDGENFTFNI